jgi:hypothetical protein
MYMGATIPAPQLVEMHVKSIVGRRIEFGEREKLSPQLPKAG